MAGVFALLYGLFSTGSMILDTSKREYETEKNRKKAIENNQITYWGGDNTRYLTDGNIPCTDMLINNHRVLVGTKGKYKNKIVYDYTQKELNEKKEFFNNKIKEARENNKKYIANMSYHVKDFGTSYISGYEIDSNKKYIVYSFHGYYFLRYLNNSPISVYEKDRYIERYEYASEHIEISKDEYNERIDL